jgi:hypothetical protein
LLGLGFCVVAPFSSFSPTTFSSKLLTLVMGRLALAANGFVSAKGSPSGFYSVAYSGISGSASFTSTFSSFSSCSGEGGSSTN